MKLQKEEAIGQGAKNRVYEGVKETHLYHLYPEVSASTVLTADFSPQRAFPSLLGCSALELTQSQTKLDQLAEASTNLFCYGMFPLVLVFSHISELTHQTHSRPTICTVILLQNKGLQMLSV